MGAPILQPLPPKSATDPRRLSAALSRRWWGCRPPPGVAAPRSSASPRRLISVDEELGGHKVGSSRQRRELARAASIRSVVVEKQGSAGRIVDDLWSRSGSSSDGKIGTTQLSQSQTSEVCVIELDRAIVHVIVSDTVDVGHPTQLGMESESVVPR